MIPIRDDIASRTTPFATYGIIALNLLAFWYEIRLGQRSDRFVEAFGLVPLRFHAMHDPIRRFMPVLTSMFLHAGVMHLIGNMLFLKIFGDNVEDRLGHVRFLLFYLGCGTIAALVQADMQPRSTIPMIGASGAIAGVTGAYFVFYPRARVLILVPFFLLYEVFEISAVIFLLLWFMMQIAFAISELGVSPAAGTAWWAHVGGFAGGVVGAMVLGHGIVRRFGTLTRPAVRR
jgi:membrane associated rhomboid family serine protease